MTNRRELADRLEAAECGSRELDHLVAKECGSSILDRWAERTVTGEFLGSVPLYTTSLDAALALAERVYPDGWLDLWIRNGTATAHQCFEGNKAFRSEPHKRPAIAVCAAILRARLDDEGKGLPEPPKGPVA